MAKRRRSKVAETVASRIDHLKLGNANKVWIGVDVHKKSYSVAVCVDGMIVLTWHMPRDHQKFIEMLKPIQEWIVKIVYEAGPTGYGFARDLERAGYDVGVVAGGKTHRAPNRGNKSDRVDCRQLATFARNNQLTYVSVPSEEQEAERQVLRLQDQLKLKRKRIKQQIRSFLLQHGIKEPKGLNHWSKAALDTLGRLQLREHLRFTLDELLHQLADLNRRLERVKDQLNKIDQTHAGKMEIALSHPGVGEETARHFVLEIFRPDRFRNAKQVALFVGLAPGVDSSGDKRKKTGRLAAGLPALRCCLIQASWAWIRKDAQGRALYARLCQNTGMATKAITGVARHLAIHLWRMLQTGEYYRAQPAV
jgi:transposase